MLFFQEMFQSKTNGRVFLSEKSVPCDLQDIRNHEFFNLFLNAVMGEMKDGNWQLLALPVHYFLFSLSK